MLARLRYPSLFLLLLLGLTLAGCGVPEKQYSDLQTMFASAQNDNDMATAQLSSMQKELDITKEKGL